MLFSSQGYAATSMRQVAEAVAYHLTLSLLTGLGPAPAQTLISQEALAGIFLQRLHEPE